MSPLKTPVAIIAFCMLAFQWGCSSPTDDEAPVETPEPSLDEATDVTDLLPAQTLLVASVQLDEFRAMRRHSVIPEELFAFFAANDPIVELLLADESPQGLDGTGALLLAISGEGTEETLSTLRMSSPAIIDFEDGLPISALHLRVVAPAVDADGLATEIEAHCEKEVCADLLDVSARDHHVTIDSFARIDHIDDTAGVPDFEAKEGFSVDETAAWKSFRDSAAPLAAYVRTEALFDLLAILELRDRAASVAVDADRLPLDLILSVSGGLDYDDATTAEAEDLAFLIHTDGPVVFADVVASLTEYGQSLVDALSGAVPMKERHRTDALLDIRWGLDLTEALSRAERPVWVGRINGIEDASFPIVAEGLARDSTWGLRMGFVRSPVTSYAMYDAFFGDETTPAEFSMIRGFWLQIFDVADDEARTAMGLHLPPDAPIDAFSDFAATALLPFGRSPDTRTVEIGDGQEFQASTVDGVTEFFAGGEQTVDSGVRIRADLRRIAAMTTQVDAAFGVGGGPSMGLHFLASLGDGNVHFYTGFDSNQGLARLQWGGEELVEPTPVEDARPPRRLTGPSPCLVTARQWSFLGLHQLDELDDDGDKARLADEMATQLDGLAAECDDQGDRLEALADQWRQLK